MNKKIKTLMLISIAFFGNQILKAQQTYNYAGISYPSVSNGNDKWTVTSNTDLNGAYLNQPNGIALDTFGRPYFSQWHRILLIDNPVLRGRSGRVGNPSSSFGHKDMASNQAEYSDPRGVAVDPNTDELYICDFSNNVIRKLTPFNNSSSNAQSVSTFAGTWSFSNSGSTDGALASAKFNGPNDIVIMKNGDIYVSEEDNNTIRKISGGMVSTVAGSAAALGDVDGIGSAARFKYPRGLCIEDQNNILIADFGNSKIKRLNLTTGAVTTVVTTNKSPQDVVSVAGVLYITEKTTISKYENATLSIFLGSTSSADSTFGTFAQTRFGDLRKITYNEKEQTLFAVDYFHGIIKKIDLFKAPVVNFVATPTAASVTQVILVKDQTANRRGTRKWTITPSSYTLVNGTTLSSETLQVEFGQSGSYTISLTYTYPEGTKTETKTGYINVSNVSAVPVTNFFADFPTQKPNTDIVFTDLSSNNPTSRIWTITPSAGVSFQNSTTLNSKFPVLQFANEGKYTIKLSCTNSQGTDDETKIDYITIDQNANDITLIDSKSIVIYPNPANETINIKGIVNAQFILYNSFGQQVLAGTMKGSSIDISSLSNGIFSLVLTNSAGSNYQGKVVKH